MKNIIATIKLFLFARFFKKYVKKSINDTQKKMFELSEAGLKHPQYSRMVGASTFILVYAYYKQLKGVKVVVVGSRYLRDLAGLIVKDRRFPIVAHNLDSQKGLNPELLIIDQSNFVSEKFTKETIIPLQSLGAKVIEIDTK